MGTASDTCILSDGVAGASCEPFETGAGADGGAAAVLSVSDVCAGAVRDRLLEASKGE